MPDVVAEQAAKMGGRLQKLRRLEALRQLRLSWISDCKEITTYLLPRCGRYLSDDKNRSNKDRQSSIYDNTATLAHQGTVSGLITYGTSPAKTWFRMKPKTANLIDNHAVKAWFQVVVDLMHEELRRSNFYIAVRQLYDEVVAFGTAACIMLPEMIGGMPDPEKVLHFYPLTAGEFFLQKDSKGKVDTCYREFRMTACAMVEEFGEENCSDEVKRAHREHPDQEFDVIHAIERRKKRNSKKADYANMEWESCYFEGAGNANTTRSIVDNDKFLRKSGFRRFPVLAPSWNATGGDVYGVGPGLMALGDIKGLQLKQLRLQMAIDQKADPSRQLPTDLQNQEFKGLPGEDAYYDQTTPSGGIRAAFQIDLDVADLRETIAADQHRINRAFYADAFQMMSLISDTTQRTAVEMNIRQQEQMSILGPTVERQETELQRPLLEFLFEEMWARGRFPPEPPELVANGALEAEVEFISLLAQAQKSIGVDQANRWVAEMAQVAAIPGCGEVTDNFDFDKWARDTSDKRGVNPTYLKAPAKVNSTREARNKMAAQQAAAESQNLQSGTVKNLAASPVEAGTALASIAAAGSEVNEGLP